MDPVSSSEILSLTDYELARAERRRRLLEVKAARRVAIGDHLTLLFENRDTVLYQIQEMLRIERIVEPAAIEHEIETYNELIAATDELRATLLIEYADAAERDRQLRALVGLDEHLWLDVDGQERCRAVFDDRQISEHRISSVHYVTFPLGTSRAAALRAGATASVGVDHPRMEREAVLTDAQRAALASDLGR